MELPRLVSHLVDELLATGPEVPKELAGLIADEVMNDPPHPRLDPFRPSRFANRDASSVAS